VIERLEANASGVTRFRVKLLLTMMVVISSITAAALFLVQRRVATAAQTELQRQFQTELTALHSLQELRQAALEERCRSLVRRPRIHAALEDNALDLLYPSAKDELRDLMAPPDAGLSQNVYGLHAEFYRFLDRNGAVIPPPSSRDVGMLTALDEAKLALPTVPQRIQLGYVVHHAADASGELREVIAMPIISSESGEVIAALELGFKPSSLSGARPDSGIKRGVWLEGVLHLPALNPVERRTLAAEVAQAISGGANGNSGFGREIDGAPHRLFFKLLNPGSDFPPAYEVCIYPLTELRARQRELRWQVLTGGALLLLGGFITSHIVAARFSRPVEKLAVDSAENAVQRQRAEARLESTSEELQRAARFSADASHQLKTPVTVLRAGLEEFLAREQLSPEACHEISGLVHQTYRLTSVIEDLLLLSRMEAGRLQIEYSTVDISQLIEAALDDLGVQPDAMHLTVETDFQPEIFVSGEKRYLSLILQNLLENARKYNRPDGKVRVAAAASGDCVYVTIGNTGKPIGPEAQAHIFERFHRGAVGENVPGHGLGLNLARELARLHRGELRLVRSDEEWTEFELVVRRATAAVNSATSTS
jgi:signal transduction histidine kinase